MAFLLRKKEILLILTILRKLWLEVILPQDLDKNRIFLTLLLLEEC